jgi:hypothetical protein
MKLRGITPILFNRVTDEQLMDIWLKRKAPKNAPRPEPREAAEPKLYQVDGWPVIPANCFMACCTAAGVLVRLDGKRQVSTAKSTTLPGFFAIEEEYAKIYTKEGKRPKWEVDIQRGVNPNGGELVAVIRPRIDDWTFTFHVSCDLGVVGEDLIRSLVDKAGRSMGLLDFRPQKKGIYGQFVVDEWKKLKAAA